MMAAIAFDDVRIRYDKAEEIAIILFSKCGIPECDAKIIADNLLFADARGVSTHGLSRVQSYCQRAKSGYCNVKPRIETIAETDSVLLIDGDRGYGAVIGTYAMERTMDKARKTGFALCLVRNSSHFGAAAYYSTMAAKQDLIGFSCTNAVPNMAPYGSASPVLGTNPFSIAAPASGRPPIVLDIASSVVARGNIINAAREGASISLGWALDNEGKPTTDAQAALKGCVIPFGGHKGSGIALFIDVLCGVLSGGVFGSHVRSEKVSSQTGIPGSGVGHAFAVIDIASLQDVKVFKTRVTQEVEEIKSARKAEGVSEILVPGDLEDRKEADCRKNGVWISKGTFNVLQELCNEMRTGINMNDAIVS